MNPGCRDSPSFTARQGQYLAFIHAYTLVLGRPPAEADMQRFFRVSPPAVHQMIVSLERAGLITRRPGVARSIAVLVERTALPELVASQDQPVKTTVARYQSGSACALCNFGQQQTRFDRGGPQQPGPITCY